MLTSKNVKVVVSKFYYFCLRFHLGCCWAPAELIDGGKTIILLYSAPVMKESNVFFFKPLEHHSVFMEVTLATLSQQLKVSFFIDLCYYQL